MLCKFLSLNSKLKIQSIILLPRLLNQRFRLELRTLFLWDRDFQERLITFGLPILENYFVQTVSQQNQWFGTWVDKTIIKNISIRKSFLEPMTFFGSSFRLPARSLVFQFQSTSSISRNISEKVPTSGFAI